MEDKKAIISDFEKGMLNKLKATDFYTPSYIFALNKKITELKDESFLKQVAPCFFSPLVAFLYAEEVKAERIGKSFSAYADTVAKMKVGEVYPELVESTYGYHIIKLNAINDGGRVNSETEREEYANTLFNDITTKKNLKYDEEKFKKFVKTLDANAYSDDSTTSTTTTTTTTTGT